MRQTPRTKGPHKTQRLSAIAVRNVKTPGRYPDGNCLYLEVDDTGAKRWLLRIVVHGRRRDIGLGNIAHTSLADIRQIAGELRSVARNGGDPLTARPRAQKGSNFRAVSKRVFEEHKPTWRNDKHRYQWLRTVEVWAYPVVGDQPISTIGRPDILRILQPVWLKKPETARRLRRKRCPDPTLPGRRRVGDDRAWRAIDTTIVTSLRLCGRRAGSRC